MRLQAQPPLSRQALRRVDRLALRRFGLPTLLLMENAARAVAIAALGRLRDERLRGVIAVCGRGYNGGDGLAAARHLHNAGVPVAVVLVARIRDLADETALHARAVRAMGIPILRVPPNSPRRALSLARAKLGATKGPALVLDALLGTGASRPVTGTLAGMIIAINARGDAGDRVLAVDLPSGMDADTGRGWGPDGAPMVRAHDTLTLAAPKIGFGARGARRWTGRITLGDIGVPRTLLLSR